MSDFDQEKCEEISQAISALLDRSKATMGEGCAAMSLALRCWLDMEPDILHQAFLTMHVIKSLTKDKRIIEIIKPNGN